MSCRIPYNTKYIFRDTVWSVAGLVLMNVAAQFIVYPCWHRNLGSEVYGNIVYLLSIMNIFAVSIGSGINYTRMRQSVDGSTRNKPYILLMVIGTVFSLLMLLILKAVNLLQINTMDFILFCILTVITMWRYYADVEFRLHVNYKEYFLYYLIIGLGYLTGISFFKVTGLWPLALLPGEITGLLFVMWRGSIFSKEVNAQVGSSQPILRLASILIGTSVLSHLIYNGDRIVLQLFAGSTAVTIYYIASLFGKAMTLITTPLNGVLVGHLAKYKGGLTRKMMNQVTIISIGVVVVSTLVCVEVSWFILPFLYPTDFQESKRFLFLVNAAQVIYFVGNVLIASILLRFTHTRNQLLVNVVHGILFVIICIPTASLFGINGFCWGLFIVNLIRYILCIMIGYLDGRMIHKCI